MIKKTVGYLLIVVGFLFLALGVSTSSQIINNLVPLPAIPLILTNVLGVIFLIAGIYLTWPNGNKHNDWHEVPIYEGHGKDKKIIGYKKVNKK